MATIKDIQALSEGAALIIDRGAWTEEAEYVSGPHFNSKAVYSASKVVVRGNGGLELVPLIRVAVKPPEPLAGQTWTHKVNGGTRYVVVATEGFVILKHSPGQRDERVSVTTVSDFVARYRLT